MSWLAWCLLLPASWSAQQLWSVDLEADDGGLSAYGDTVQWEWGAPTSGPGGGYESAHCWATQLEGWYLNDAVDYLELPALPLSGATRPVLVFQQWYSLQSGDLGTIELRRAGIWEEAEPIYGYPMSGGYSGASDDWETAWVDLSGLSQGDTLRLVIAADGAGAAPGWYLDQLELWDGDIAPPLIELDGCLADTEDPVGPYPVEVEVLDDVGLSSVLLLYSVDGGPVRRVTMTHGTGPVWTGSIPGQEAGSTVSYLIEANDAENRSEAPEEGCSFEVRLPAPTDLRAPSGTLWGTVAPISWTPPESSHTVDGYRVYRDGALLLEVEQPEAEPPVVSGEQSFAVSAVFELGEGSLSEPVTVVAAVPELRSLEPDQGYQGDNLRLTLQGEYLLLEQGDLQLGLGDGIRVLDLDVRDVDLVYATVTIATSAPAGMRDLELVTGGETLLILDVFEVMPGSERPQLTGVEPDTVRQGDELDLLIGASEPFAEPPTVWLGEHILVEDVELLDETTVSVGVVVPYVTPLGTHTLEVDDGVRIYSGLPLQVRDYIAPIDPGGTCSSVPARPGWLGLIAGLGLAVSARRRRRRA